MKTYSTASCRDSNWWQTSKCPLQENMNVNGLEMRLLFNRRCTKGDKEDSEDKLLHSVERQPPPPLALKLWRGAEKGAYFNAGEEERRGEERTGAERRGEERVQSACMSRITFPVYL